MSILIKGMEMPTNCDECVFFEQYRGEVAYCGILNSQIPCECPLVPVPPHGALMDRDDFFATCPELVDRYKRITDDLVVIPAEGGE